MCAAPGRCRPTIDRGVVACGGSASPGAADAPRRTGPDADAPDDHHGTAQVTLPPGSFLQADRRRRRGAGRAGGGSLQARQAYRRSLLRGRTVRASAGPKSRVAAFDSDAGCGRGTAKGGGIRPPDLKPLKAEARDLFRRPLMPQELRDYDTVVFDPPRQGAQAQARSLPASKVPTVIAVSCNVATFARDAHPGRWRLYDRRRHAGRPVPHTPHVELVARFVRKR